MDAAGCLYYGQLDDGFDLSLNGQETAPPTGGYNPTCAEMSDVKFAGAECLYGPDKNGAQQNSMIGNYDSKSTTLEACKAECSSTDGCTAYGFDAGVSHGVPCQLFRGGPYVAGHGGGTCY